MNTMQRVDTAADEARDGDFVEIGGSGPSSSLGRIVITVWALCLLLTLVVGVTRSVLLRTVLRDHEIAGVTRSIEDQVRLGVEPALSPGLLAGNREAFDEFDSFVRRQLVTADTIRLTLYTADGTVVWALLPDRVGDQDSLPAEALDVLENGVPSAQHTDPHGNGNEAVEVLALVDGPNGERMLWEADLPREDVARRADQLVVTVTIIELVGLGVLLTVQGVLGRSIVRRHDRERAYRRWLTQRVSEVALVERRQIAADLHDGVVQDLTGLALDLEAPVGRPEGLSAEERRDRSEFAARLRRATAQLRGQAAELYPPAAADIDVEESLQRMLDRIPPTMSGELDVHPDAVVVPVYRWLVFRVAQEALRNAVQHSGASAIRVRLRPSPTGTILTVEDDGVGFSPAADAVVPGHMGLSLMSDMAKGAGAVLAIRSAPGEGTTVRLETPS
jgi:signal transduction histidine kinase